MASERNDTYVASQIGYLDSWAERHLQDAHHNVKQALGETIRAARRSLSREAEMDVYREVGYWKMAHDEIAVELHALRSATTEGGEHGD